MQKNKPPKFFCMLDVRNIFNYYVYKPIYYKRNHILIRCPFCGDSVKNVMHAHLYIEPDLMVFWCARCYEGGSLAYLLTKIRDRFSIDVNPIINQLRNVIVSNISLQKSKQINLDITYIEMQKLKQKLSQESIARYRNELEYYFIKKQINISEHVLHQLPIAMYDVVYDYLLPHKDRLDNSLVVFTIGNRVIYRYDYLSLLHNFKTERRFMNLYLAIGRSYQALQYSLFTLLPYNFDRKFYQSYNLSRKNLLLVSEGLTDMILYAEHLLTSIDTPITCLVLNGKWYEIIKDFEPLFDNITVIVDNDAATKAYIAGLKINSKLSFVIPVTGNDLRESKKYLEVEI